MKIVVCAPRTNLNHCRRQTLNFPLSIFNFQFSINQRHGEGELRLAVPAGDADIFAVAAYDGLNDVQAQTPAVPVLGAGFVQLVEPVKDQRQLLRRDGVAVVADGDVGLGIALPDLQAQGAALGTAVVATLPFFFGCRDVFARSSKNSKEMRFYPMNLRVHWGIKSHFLKEFFNSLSSAMSTPFLSAVAVIKPRSIRLHLL